MGYLNDSEDESEKLDSGCEINEESGPKMKELPSF